MHLIKKGNLQRLAGLIVISAAVFLAAFASIILLVPSLLIGFLSLGRDELHIPVLFLVVLLGYLVPQLHVIAGRAARESSEIRPGVTKRVA